jgi:hypothetical protein
MVFFSSAGNNHIVAEVEGYASHQLSGLLDEASDCSSPISVLSAFRDRGVPGPTSECRRVPQPRWVEREGKREGGERGGRRPA